MPVNAQEWQGMAVNTGKCPLILRNAGEQQLMPGNGEEWQGLAVDTGECQGIPGNGS